MSNLLDLPPELLDLILEFTVQTAKLRSIKTNNASLLSACLTCQALRFAAQRQLFRYISVSIIINPISEVSIKIPERFSNLHRLLQERPLLQSYVQHVQVGFRVSQILESTLPANWEANMSDPAWLQLSGLFSSLSRAKSLIITEWSHAQGAAEVSKHSTSIFFCALAMMTRLELLDVAMAIEVDVKNLIRRLEPLNRLKTLKLRCRFLGYSAKLDDGMEDFEITLPVQNLRLHGLAQYKEVLKSCKNLTRFQWVGFTLDPQMALKPIPNVQTVLAQFQSTLQHLEIDVSGHFHSPSHLRPTISNLNLSELTALQSLTINNWLFDRDCKAYELYQAMFTNRLRSVHWRWNQYFSSHGECIDQYHLKTISQALECAHVSHSSPASLKIEVIFNEDQRSAAIALYQEMSNLHSSLVNYRISGVCAIEILNWRRKGNPFEVLEKFSTDD